MPTKNLVPRGDGEGKLGVVGDDSKRWGEVNGVLITANTITSQNFNTSGGDLVIAGSEIVVTKNVNGQFVIDSNVSTVDLTASSLSNLGDVAAYSSSDNGKFLKYNGTTWSAQEVVQTSSLNDLSDVTISGQLQASQVLEYNGDDWVNVPRQSPYWRNIGSSTVIGPNENITVQVDGNLIEVFDLGDVDALKAVEIVDGGSLTGPVSYTADCGIISQSNIF